MDERTDRLRPMRPAMTVVGEISIMGGSNWRHWRAVLVFVMLPLAVPSAAREGSTLAAPVKRTIPEYPRSAKRLGVEGWVLVDVMVDASGNVVAPRIIEASPPGVFDAAAIKAILDWKYAPLAESESKETANRSTRVKLTFTLN